MDNFFVSCPLNFENELIQEIEGFWFQLMDLDGLPTREVPPEFTLFPGGIEFKCKLHLGLQINFFSKLALRVLWRIGSFEARYFDQYEKGLAQIEFEKYFVPQKVNIHIEAAKSRLFHESNLLECSLKVLSLKKIVYDKEAELNLFIRLHKDRVVISLDTSGAHLHFRGYRKYQGEAPLRENLASLALQLAQVPSALDQILFDPYCGAGTFFFEAQIKKYPHLQREYSFLQFKNIPAVFKSSSWSKNYRWPRWPTHIKYVGIEKNSETLKKAILNQNEFTPLFGPIDIQWLENDSEKIDLAELESIFEGRPVILITNPPYGERSARGQVIESLARFEKLKNLKKMVILHPENWKFNFSKLKCVYSKPLSNQGLETNLSIFS